MNEPTSEIEPLPTKIVDPDEPVSRYLLRPRWFDVKKNRVFAQAFNPPKATLEFPIRQTSIYRIRGCTETEIWQIGDDYVTELHPQRLPILGRADLSAQTIFSADLLVSPQPHPHPRHADIEGWPTADEQLEMKLAYLSSNAKLIVK